MLLKAESNWSAWAAEEPGVESPRLHRPATVLAEIAVLDIGDRRLVDLLVDEVARQGCKKVGVHVGIREIYRAGEEARPNS